MHSGWNPRHITGISKTAASIDTVEAIFKTTDECLIKLE